jgi:Ataxin-3
MASFDRTPIYFEPQVAALCGRHAVNNLLQGPFYNEVDLAAIATELDEQERALMMEAGADTADALRYMAEDSFNVDDSGNFSISVLREAVNRSHGISFDSEPAQVERALRDPNNFQGFLLNLDSHWFIVRKLVTAAGPRWFNLNSLQKAPSVLGEFFVAAFLAQMKQDGYSIFVVVPGPLGRLPDPVDTSQGDPRCWRRIGDVLAQSHTAEDARHSAAVHARETAAHDPEFEAALRASLAMAGETAGGDESQGHKRVRRTFGDDDQDDPGLQQALRMSLMQARGGSAAAAASAPLPSPSGSTSSDGAELEAALALSLGGDDSSGAVPAPSGTAVPVSIALVVLEIQRLRAAIAAAEAAAAASSAAEAAAGGVETRLQVKLPSAPPFHSVDSSGRGVAPAAAAPAPASHQRRFKCVAPVAAVLDWAALCWLESSYPEAAVAAAAASPDVGAPEAARSEAVFARVPPFTLSAAMGAAPPTVLASSSEADRVRSVLEAGLAPSASLTLRPR